MQRRAGTYYGKGWWDGSVGPTVRRGDRSSCPADRSKAREKGTAGKEESQGKKGFSWWTFKSGVEN